MHRRRRSQFVRFGHSQWVSIDPLPVIEQETPKYAVFFSETLETQILTERETLDLLERLKGRRKTVA